MPRLKKITNSQKKIERVCSIALIFSNNDDIVYINTLRKILQKWFKDYEILVVDNYSNEKTFTKLLSLQKTIPELRIIRLSKKYSTEVAVTCCIENSIGDYLLILDKNNLSENLIKNSLEKIIQNDIVLIRYRLKELIKTKKIFLYPLYLFIERFYNHEIFFNINYSMGLSRKAIAFLTQIKRKNINFDYLRKIIGLKKEMVFYTLDENKKNEIKKQISLLKIIKQIINSSISYSNKPLRMAIFLGIFGSFLNLCFIIYVFIITLLKKKIAEGWISTSLILGSMFFLVFIVLAIISEYILKILEETIEEPRYFIQSEYDSSIFIKSEDLNVV